MDLAFADTDDSLALRLGSAGQALPAGIAILDSRGRSVWLNRRLRRWLGYHPPSAGRVDPVHPQDRPALRQAAADAVTLGEAVVGVRLCTADGRDVETHWHVAPIDASFAQSDLVAHVVEDGRACSHAVNLDLNERRLASLVELSQFDGQSEREVAEFALEKAVELTGSEIGYLHFYHEAEALLELSIWSAETLRRCTAGPVSHYPLDQAGIWADSVRLRRPVIHNEYSKAAGSHGLPEGHFPVRRHLGVPVFGDRGRIVAVIGVGNKVEAYDEGDVRQMQLFAAGMWTIIERARMQRELVAARNAAQHASNAKSDFLANMSHEMRTPLNAILGFSECLQMELFGPLGDERYRDYGHDIAKAAHQLLAIVNDLLDLARIEKGGLTPEEGRFDLVPLLDVAVRTVGLHAGTRNIGLVAHCGYDRVELAGDRRLIAQMLLTLLGNAVAVSPPGSTVEVAVSADPAGTPAIAVTDRGPAMCEEEIEIAVTPFGRAAAPTTSAERGSGLGLAVAKSLAEMHGGSLAVDSDPTAGTTVTVRLPAAPNPDAGAAG
jgi:signal transduction histidine kinase